MQPQQLVLSLQKLFLAFPTTTKGNEELTAKIYIEAVKDIPAQFVCDACDRFIRGQVSRIDQRFLPSTAELCCEATRVWHKALDERSHEEKERLRLEHTEEPKEGTPEGRKQFVDSLLKPNRFYREK